MFLSIDGTFWVQLINFAIFFAILNVVFMRPVGEAIKRRRAYIDSVQSDFERHEKEARTLRAGAEHKRAIARRGAEDALAKARTSAEDEATTLTVAAGERAQAIAEDARRVVAGEYAAAKSREDELASTLAATLIARATGARS